MFDLGFKFKKIMYCKFGDGLFYYKRMMNMMHDAYGMWHDV